ncbi:MAG TPA: recombinase family protein [bacterium]|nr:recombinase family protein [bacterium]
MRTAIYARYSSALQRETSLEDQIALCRSASDRFGCVVAEEHIYVDQESSGSEARRDGYQRLLAAARRKAFEAILVEDQSRLWRDIEEAARALKRLRFLGVSVFSVASGTNLADEKTGSLISIVTAWKDSVYLSDLAARTQRGLAGQARRGFVAGGRSYGYTSEPVLDSAHLDAHGQPRVVGYRRVIHEGQAEIVRRIFAQFAAGWTPKRIVHALNAEHVPPPRGQRGWTWTALYGNPKLGTGILNNALYCGEVVWNKFRWEKNPETGKRVPRVRDRTEWIVQHDESLRIVPQDLWDRVKDRQHAASERAARQGHSGGISQRYLFSGLLRCGVCGARYIMRDGARYGCSYHVNRGPDVCGNSLHVRRVLVEDRLLRVIRDELFSPDAIAFLTRSVNEGLRQVEAERSRTDDDREQLASELREAMAELDHIREAIRRGLLSDLTKQMLDETESKVRTLRARLDTPSRAQVRALRQLPDAIRRRLEHLARVLHTDIDEARTALRGLLGDIVLEPTPAGLVAHLTGNLEGLLALTGDQAPSGGTGSGGRI